MSHTTYHKFMAAIGAALLIGSQGAAITLSMNDLQSDAPSVHAASPNPLLEKWTGPYQGVPPFDKVRVDDFKPALEAAMAENLSEIDKIAGDPGAPTFENTIAAMERTGRTLDRVQTIYGIWSSNMSSPEFRAVETEMDPKLAAFADKITQNTA